MLSPKVLCLSLILCTNVLEMYAARILFFIPTASVSHQIVSKGLYQELAKRGHEVVAITTSPMFTKGNMPNNLTEIDVQEAGYEAKKLNFAKTVHGQNDDVLPQVMSFFQTVFTEMFDAEVKTDQVQALINDKSQKFDLLILEACTQVSLVFSHIFKAPVILLNSFGTIEMFTDYTGAATHPMLYPTVIHQKLYNLNFFDKIYEMYKHYVFENELRSLQAEQNKMLRRSFGANTPPLSELQKNIAMVFLAEHHLWDHNRPVPPNTLYIGGIYPQRTYEPLPKDIENYLNESVNGVIYVSFGTTVHPSLLPEQIIQTIINALSKLPFDILLKWDTDNLLGIPKNVKIFHWVPQSEILHHPKIKLFVTQGGLQSTDDAIAAGVPLVGMPLLGDQWYNVEQYIKHKIGQKVDIETITEEKLINTINTVVNDDSYRRNIISLRDNLNDQPQTPLERAVWWCEYVIRHKGARYLQAPTAFISNWDYYEIDLLLFVTLWVLAAFLAAVSLAYSLMYFYCGVYKKSKVD